MRFCIARPNLECCRYTLIILKLCKFNLGTFFKLSLNNVFLSLLLFTRLIFTFPPSLFSCPRFLKFSFVIPIRVMASAQVLRCLVWV